MMRWLAGVCMVIGLTCWAIPSYASPDPGMTSDKELRLHLKWKHQFQFAGYYIALEKGYYAAEGLNVSLIEGGPKYDPVEKLLAGDVEYAISDAGVLLERADGKPVVVLANVFQHSPQILMLRSEPGHVYKTPADLRGKRIMLQSGYLTVEVLALLKKFGLSESDYIRQPSSFDVHDLMAGKTDAFPAYSTNEPYLMRQEGVPFSKFEPHDYGIDFYGDTLVTTEYEMQNHPKRAAAFRRASIKGWKYALEHLDETVDLIYGKYNSQYKSREHLHFEGLGIRDLVFHDVVPIGQSELKRWHYIQDVFDELGYKTGDIDWDVFIYRDEPDIVKVLWFYRYWILFVLLGGLVLLLFLYTVQLRTGIRKRTAALEQISSEYKDILDHMQDAYYRADMKGNIVWVSLACQRHLGYTRSQLIGRPMRRLFYQMDEYSTFTKALDESGGHLQHFEICLKHLNDAPVWVEVNAQYCYGKESELLGIEGNVRNITERKQAERESLELTGQLQQAQKMESIGVLAGGIAHDFNNLLVSMMGNAELALLDAPEQSEMRYYLQQIFKASRQGADLVRQMLAYSGQGRFAMGDQNLNILVRDVSDLLVTVIGKNALLKQELMPDLANVYGDKNQLTQLIMNLITNASEALSGKPGEITLRTGVRSLTKTDFIGMYMSTEQLAGEYVFIEVEDNGCGMDQATRARIFDPFFSTKETGSGLGLAALLGIVRSHRGTLALQSQPDRGSCFTIYLPMLTTAKEIVDEHEQTGEFVTPFSLRGIVLVVDDEKAVRDVAKRLLEHEGIQVITANGGDKAMTLFRQHADELAFVLLDLTMPKMDGEELFYAMQAIRADIPVLLSSGFPAVETVERLQKFGLAGFVRKPYTRKALLEEVAHIAMAGNPAI